MVVGAIRRWWRGLRGGSRADLNEQMSELLSHRGVRSSPAENSRVLVRSLSLPPGTRTGAVLELQERRITHLLTTTIGGRTELSGQLSLVGTHVLVDRSWRGGDWPEGWSLALRAQPVESLSALGEAREFEWRSSDASDRASSEAARLLSENERVQHQMTGLMREASTIQLEVAPTGERLRIAVHQSVRGLPDPSSVESLLSIARALSGG